MMSRTVTPGSRALRTERRPLPGSLRPAGVARARPRSPPGPQSVPACAWRSSRTSCHAVDDLPGELGGRPHELARFGGADIGRRAVERAGIDALADARHAKEIVGHVKFPERRIGPGAFRQFAIVGNHLLLGGQAECCKIMTF